METRKTKEGLRYREMIYIEGRNIKGPFFTKKSDAKKWKAQQILKRDQGKLGQTSYKVKKTKLTDF